MCFIQAFEEKYGLKREAKPMMMLFSALIHSRLIIYSK